MRNTRWRFSLLALLLLAFALRLYRLDYQELRGDEAFGYFFSLRSLPDIVQATLDLQEPHPVASYDLQHYWLAWAGHSEFALRFPAAWFGLLAVALLYALGRQLLRPGTALFATLLLALSPYAIWHSQDARMYSMSLALTTASTWLMVLWLQRQRRWLAVGYLITSLLALHTHYFAVFVLVAQNLFVLGRTARYPRLRVTLINWVILQITVAFFYGPWLLRVLPILGTYGGNGDSPTFLAMIRRSFSVFVVGENIPAAQSVWWAWLAVMLLLLGTVALWRQGDRGRRTLTLLALLLFIPLLATWWGARTRPIFNERYLVAALPGFYLLIGAALETVAWPRRGQKRSDEGLHRFWSVIRAISPLRNVATLSILLLLFTLGGMLFSLQHHYADPVYSKTRGWRELATTLTAWSAGLPPDQVRIAQNFPDPTLWYYYQGAVDHLVLPPQPQDLLGAQQAVRELSTAGVQRVLLPSQPAANWDENGVAATALEGAYSFVTERQVGVWPLQLYSLPPRQWHSPETLESTFQNGLHLHGFALSPTQLTTDGLLVVTLAWRAANVPFTGTEKVFVQLLNSAGELVAQDDRAFSYPVSTIEHQSVYGILLPTALSPGAYHLIAGLYDPAAPGSPRLLTTAGADFIELTLLQTAGDE